MRPLTIDNLIKILEAVRNDHGNLKVYYADGYDRCFAVTCTEVMNNPHWEGQPKKGDFLCLS